MNSLSSIIILQSRTPKHINFERELSEDIAYYFNYPRTKQRRREGASALARLCHEAAPLGRGPIAGESGLGSEATLMYRVVGHMIIVGPHTGP